MSFKVIMETISGRKGIKEFQNNDDYIDFMTKNSNKIKRIVESDMPYNDKPVKVSAIKPSDGWNQVDSSVINTLTKDEGKCETLLPKTSTGVFKDNAKFEPSTQSSEKVSEPNVEKSSDNDEPKDWKDFKYDDKSSESKDDESSEKSDEDDKKKVEESLQLNEYSKTINENGEYILSYDKNGVYTIEKIISMVGNIAHTKTIYRTTDEKKARAKYRQLTKGNMVEEGIGDYLPKAGFISDDEDESSEKMGAFVGQGTPDQLRMAKIIAKVKHARGDRFGRVSADDLKHFDEYKSEYEELFGDDLEEVCEGFKDGLVKTLGTMATIGGILGGVNYLTDDKADIIARLNDGMKGELPLVVDFAEPDGKGYVKIEDGPWIPVSTYAYWREEALGHHPNKGEYGLDGVEDPYDVYDETYIPEGVETQPDLFDDDMETKYVDGQRCLEYTDIVDFMKHIDPTAEEHTVDENGDEVKVLFKTSTPVERIKDEVYKKFGDDVKVSKAQYRYAPEMKYVALCYKEDTNESIDESIKEVLKSAGVELNEDKIIEKNPYEGDTFGDYVKASMWRPKEDKNEADGDIDPKTGKEELYEEEPIEEEISPSRMRKYQEHPEMDFAILSADRSERSDEENPMARQLQENDILVQQFGYGMTITTFFKVIGKTPSGKSVRVVSLKSKIVSGDGYGQEGMMIPTSEVDGEVLTARVAKDYNDNECANVNNHKAYLWNGEPVYFNYCD